MGGPHSARKSKRHGDEDGVGQVGEDNGESSRWPVRRVRANDSKREGLTGGRTCVDIDGLTGLTSKPRSQSCRVVMCERVWPGVKI